MVLPPKSYPLCWPTNWPRTPEAAKELLPMSHMRVPQLVRYLHIELTRLGAEEIVLSMAAPLRENGTDSVPGMDSGVVVWWRRDKTWSAFGCDVSRRAFANLTNTLNAITRLRELYTSPVWQSAEALLTGIEVDDYTEYGTYSAGPEDFHDFHQAPPSTNGSSAQWWHVFGFTHPHEASLKETEKRYRQHARKAHPDLPTGSEEAMRTFNEAIEQARNYFARQEAS